MAKNFVLWAVIAAVLMMVFQGLNPVDRSNSWSYSEFMTAWSYRRIFTVGNLVYFAAVLLDVVFFLRWHRPYVTGHPRHAVQTSLSEGVRNRVADNTS